MAKSQKLTDQELDDLKSVGFVEGDMNTIPENINPGLKSRILEQWAADNNVTDPLDMPTAVERQNAMVRERAKGDDDGTVRQSEAATARDPLDHDGDGRRGGHIDNRKK